MRLQEVRELAYHEQARIKCVQCDEPARFSELHRSVIQPSGRTVLSFFYWCLACALEHKLPIPRWKESQ